MKIILYSGIALLLSLGLLVLGIRILAEGHSRAGLLADQLSPCPNTPNCVCSEVKPVDTAYIEPLVYSGAVEPAWQRARMALLRLGGRLIEETDGYIWVEFTSRWLRFVDDVELRLDSEHQRIHMRSASRIGRYDFQINRHRLEDLRLLFKEMHAG